jgi:protein-S-isoprenylcysteine O-methyltransferase Ste14
MIAGVLSILLGEAILFGSMALFCWFPAFLIVNALYMPLCEEPGLEQRFGDDFRLYRAHVPRWLPRLSPWEPPPGDKEAVVKDIDRDEVA